ncbi:MAG: MopE-related protein, partial [Acidimicrobiales bacterium]|nr:MopE-related protein [Acidimicrobiales bacterium]
GESFCTDCDDGDPANFNGNSEVCDGADNDCNNVVDDGLPFVTFYRDGDSDSYGDAAVSLTNCAQPSGFVVDDTDCDDGVFAINPGVSESLCDSVDNDCEPATPDDLDGDGDGFSACVECDDGDADIFPGAVEVCDGSDSDCDGYDCPLWFDDFESGTLEPHWLHVDDFGWSVTDQVVYEGAHAVASGPIGDDNTSTLKISLLFLEEGSIVYRTRGSTEENEDLLTFSLNSTVLDTFSGEWSWESHSYVVPAGVHTVAWQYHKDFAISGGADTVFVDLVEVEGGVPLEGVVPWVSPTTGMELIPIPAGTFTMGSPDEKKYRGWGDETQHTVTLTQGFHIGTTEVTQALYQAVMRDNPSRNKGR